MFVFRRTQHGPVGCTPRSCKKAPLFKLVDQVRDLSTGICYIYISSSCNKLYTGSNKRRYLELEAGKPCVLTKKSWAGGCLYAD